jgi:hypothetical protein
MLERRKLILQMNVLLRREGEERREGRRGEREDRKKEGEKRMNNGIGEDVGDEEIDFVNYCTFEKRRRQ